MSAYALPGLFPPSGNTSSYKTPWSSSSTLSAIDLEKEEKVDFENNLDHGRQEQEPAWGIAVKEAKIDTARLIRALSTSSKSTATRQPQQQTGSSDSINSRSNRLRRHSSSSHQQQYQQRQTTPQEEAMQFELSISFNGRKYTAVRTLPCILKLRRDLVKEVLDRQRGQGNDNQHQQDQKERVSSSSTNGIDSLQIVANVSIPELPRPVQEGPDGNGGGTACRGFTMLHNLLRGYAPCLEGWLRCCTTLVPPQDSPSWTNFLWEPLSLPAVHQFLGSSSNNIGGRGMQSNAKTTGSRSAASPMKRRGSSMPCLAKIEESEHDDDCEE